MILKSTFAADLQAGDVVRRLGQMLTVAEVVPAEFGAVSVTFREGITVRLAGSVTVVASLAVDAPLAAFR